MPDIATLGIEIDSTKVKAGVASLRDLETGAERATHATSGLSGEFTRLAAHILTITAFVEGIHHATEEALKFSTAMADIDTIISDSSGMERMTKNVKDLAIAYGRSPVEEARGLYQVISAGVTDASKQMELLTAANTLTIDGLTDQTTAVDAVTTLWATYGKQVGSVTKLQDMMFATVAGGKIRMGDLARSIGMVASIASQAGLDLPSLLAAVDGLTNSGVPARRAIQGLREVLATVAKPTIEASRLGKQLGIDYSLAGLQAHGLAGFLKEVQEKTNGNQSQLATLTGSVQAWAALAPLAGTGADLFATALDRITNSAGESQRALEIMQKSPEFQMKQFKEQFNVLSMNVGMDILEAILPTIKAMNENFGTLTETLKLTADAAGLLAASKVANWLVAQVQSVRASIAAYNERRAVIISTAADEVEATKEAVSAIVAAQEEKRAAVVTAAEVEQAELLKTAEAAKAQASALMESLAAVDAHRQGMIDAALAEAGYARAANESTAAAIESARAMLVEREAQLSQVAAVALPFGGGTAALANNGALASYNRSAQAGVIAAKAELEKAVLLNSQTAQSEAALAMASEQASMRVVEAEAAMATSATVAAESIAAADESVVAATTMAAERVAAGELAMEAAASSASVGTGLLSGAMSFLGGPIGVVTIALIAGYEALDYWSESADRARKATVEHTKAISEQMGKEAQLTQDIQAQQAVMYDASLVTAPGLESYTSASEQLKNDIDALIAINPAFADTFKSTNTAAQNSAAGVAALNKQLDELKAKQKELENEAKNPQLTGYQKFKNFAMGTLGLLNGGGMAGSLGMPGVQDAQVASELQKNKESAQKALDAVNQSVKAGKAALDSMSNSAQDMPLLEEGLKAFTKASRESAQASAELTKEQKKQLQEATTYLHNLQSESAGLEQNWEAAQKASDSYKNLTKSQREAVDPLLDEIQARKDLAKFQDESARHAEEFAQDLARIKSFQSLSEFTPEAMASKQHAADLAKLDQRLHASKDSENHIALLTELYKKGRVDQSTYYAELIDYLDRTNEEFKTLHDVGTTVAGDLANGFEAMASGTKDAFKTMVTSILADLERLALNKTFSSLLGLGLDALASLFGGGISYDSGTIGSAPGEGVESLSWPQLRAGGPASAPAQSSLKGVPQIAVSVPVNIQGEVGDDKATAEKANQLAAHLKMVVNRSLQEELRPGGILYNAK